MTRQVLTMLLAMIFLSGCSTTSNIKDFDPEQHTKDNLDTSPTPRNVVVADRKGIIIEVIRDDDFYDTQSKTDRQRWNVFITNTNRKDKCVGVLWRLLDFQFISDYPTTLLVHHKTVLLLGTMIGEIMIIDGVAVAPPPSGYVHAMQVKKPDFEQKEGDECLFLPDEDDIVKERQIIER